MALSFLPELLISILTLLVIYLYIKSWRSRNPLRPKDWPVVGMLPSLLGNLHNFHDQLTVLLAASGYSHKAQGPVATGMRFFVTCDPANVRHIFTTNHANYPKGEEFAEIFDVVSDSLFTVDGESWRQQRGLFQSVVGNPRVLESMASCCRDKVVNGLLPFMARMASTATPFDMQDLITRLVFDLTATPVFGVDPGFLSPDMPSMRVSDAMDTVMEVGLFRHIVPASCWKVMRRLNICTERKLAMARMLLHGFVREMLEKRRAMSPNLHEVAAVDILSAHTQYSDGFLLSKILISYMIAGRDTVATALPWVFYSLAKNPHAVSAIRNELASIAYREGTRSVAFFKPEETKSLVYLQAALFETLRLYPPGPFERKAVLDDDMLPSGHKVYSNETILISIYAMGRMERAKTAMSTSQKGGSPRMKPSCGMCHPTSSWPSTQDQGCARAKTSPLRR
ncbi:hypothetical protein ACP70R_023611 [Stipagrostis hirtigluma subsp. patula]